ncbi:MAG: hypothetical protein IKW16_00280, partial [Clostridia bacterium]|nr:hypothetical protein [Clostridia bacterium]
TNPTSNTINAKSAYHVVAESVVVNIITAHFFLLLKYIIHSRAGYCKKKLQNSTITCAQRMCDAPERI